jgi:flagellin FlaB
MIKIPFRRMEDISFIYGVQSSFVKGPVQAKRRRMAADRREEGFTGLEAAIILVAFVVVAGAFSFTVLGSGYFTTQKAQKTIFTGVDQATSTLHVVGDVYGISDGDGHIDEIWFTLGTGTAGEGVDLAKLILTASSADTIATLSPADPLSSSAAGPGEWCIYATTGDPASPLYLEGGEQGTIIARLPEGAGCAGGERLTIEICPPVGAPVTISRLIPPVITTVSILT